MMFSLTLAVLACESAPSPTPTSAPQAPRADGPFVAVGPSALEAEMFGSAERTRLYNVWATWCAPCRHEMPRIKSWSEQHPEVEIVLINVDVAGARTAKAAPFLEQVGLLGARNLFLDDPDPSYALSKVVPNYRFTLPLTLVVDRKGKVKHRFDRVLRDTDLATMP